MRTIKIKILLMLTFPVSLFSQHESGEIKLIPDSVMRYQGITQPILVDYNLDELFIPFNTEMDEAANYNKSTMWMRTEMAIFSSSMFNVEEDFDNHMLIPLYTKYLEDSKFDPLRYALGIAQLSAVSYLAYRHVKRYGFLK
jgi:hypothetical protein